MTEDGPTFCDVLDPQATECHRPISCPDVTLTAFCQLGALRLNVRRCLLFFFDVNNAYVLAEATRSLSLEDDSAHDDGDQLWLGHASIPRGIACCETTVRLPALASTSMEDSPPGQDSIFVVNDLTENGHTQDRPYVTAFPHGRFYAGCPITSPDGINIGAYCVLDDDVRDGVSSRDAEFMLGMSRAVMRHLEKLRTQSELQRGSDMMTGLGSFVQASSGSGLLDPRRTERKAGNASKDTLLHADVPVGASRKIIKGGVPDALAESDDPAKDFGCALRPHSKHLGQETSKTQKCSVKPLTDPIRACGGTETAAPATSSESVPYAITNDSGAQATVRPEAGSLGDATFVQLQDTLRSSQSAPRCGCLESVNHTFAPRVGTTGVPTKSRPSVMRQLSKENKSSYQRASEIMCDSLSIDGVAFLDASVGTYGGLSEDVEDLEDLDDKEPSWPCSNSESDAVNPGVPSLSPDQKTPNPCSVLGSAMSVREHKAATQLEAQSSMKMTETFLRKLLRRYPRDKIWAYDRFGACVEGSPSSDDEDTLQNLATKQHKSCRKERQHDSEMIQAMFPGVRTLAIHGIRDSQGRRFVAGCLLWTFDPLRALTKASEMTFVAAFCNAIVAGDKRHEVQQADQAKSDFISSISHELRTPLCGILGSTEVLKDHNLDSMTTALVEQIDSCGRTLLDTIDSLLEFTNMKGQSRKQSSASNSNINSMLAGRRGSTQGEIQVTNSAIALDDLTEEAMEATVFSHFCQKSVEERSRISVVMDIDRSIDTNWYSTVDSGGWRRICLNLVSNALKYTDSGYVQISMHQKQRTPRNSEAILTITDSGKGMSQAFVNEDLFRDFTQEDTTVDGVGLGMSVVGQIVNAMQGSIEVTSDQHGAGTAVVVKVPIELRHGTRSQRESTCTTSVGTTTGQSFEGLSVGIISDSQESPLFTTDRSEQLETTAGALALSSIEKTCRYLGLQARRCTWADYDTTKLSQLNFMLEEEFQRQVNLMQTNLDARRACLIGSIPTVVICKNNPSARTIAEAWRNHPHRTGIITEYISSPSGIRTIARAVSSALRRHKVFQESEALHLQDSNSDEPTELSIRTRCQTLDDPLTSHSGLGEVNGAPEIMYPMPPSLIEAMREGQHPRSLPRLDQNPDDHISRPQISSSFNQQELIDSARSSSDSNVPVLLLVDDNNINLQLLVTYAKRYNYPYYSAVDGQQALDSYTQAHESSIPSTVTAERSVGRPSVVLMDINMPVMDGYESTQRIRAYERKHHLKPSTIIALTALSSAAAHKEAFGSGFDLFMTKPVKLKDLSAIIEGERQLGAQA